MASQHAEIFDLQTYRDRRRSTIRGLEARRAAPTLPDLPMSVVPFVFPIAFFVFWPMFVFAPRFALVPVPGHNGAA